MSWRARQAPVADAGEDTDTPEGYVARVLRASVRETGNLDAVALLHGLPPAPVGASEDPAFAEMRAAVRDGRSPGVAFEHRAPARMGPKQASEMAARRAEDAVALAPPGPARKRAEKLAKRARLVADKAAERADAPIRDLLDKVEKMAAAARAEELRMAQRVQIATAPIPGPKPSMKGQEPIAKPDTSFFGGSASDMANVRDRIEEHFNANGAIPEWAKRGRR